MAAMWVTIGLYIALLVGVALMVGKSSKSIADITVGGRQAGAWLSALSYGTAYFSTVMFVGYAGATGFGFGLWGILVGLANTVFGTLLAWLLLARRTRETAARLNLHTMPEFFEKRYGSRAMKLFSCIVIFIFFIPYSASVYKGLGSISEVLLGIDATVFMVIVAVLAAFLLFFGGYLVQARTDFIQAIITMVGVALLIFFVLRSNAVGGLEGVAQFAKTDQGLPKLNGTQWWSLLSLILMTSFGTWGLPHMLHKFYVIRDDKQAKRGTWISTLFSLLVAGGGYFIGTLCHMFIQAGQIDLAALQGKYGETFKDYLVPNMLKASNIPQILLGVVFVLLLAASVSTLCSVTLTASSTLMMDFVGTVRPKTKEKQLKLGTKLLCLIFALVSFFIARSNTPILELMSYSWGVISGSFLAPYVLSLYYKGSNKIGAWSGIATGFSIAMVPAISKMITVFIQTNPPALATKLAAQGPQFAVLAMSASVVVCFLVSWGTRSFSVEKEPKRL